MHTFDTEPHARLADSLEEHEETVEAHPQPLDSIPAWLLVGHAQTVEDLEQEHPPEQQPPAVALADRADLVVVEEEEAHPQPIMMIDDKDIDMK